MAAERKCVGETADVMPLDIATKAARSGLGESTLICVGTHAGWLDLVWTFGIAYVLLPGAYAITWSAFSGESNGWQLWAFVLAWYVFMICAFLYQFYELDPRRRRMHIVAFSRGIVRRDRRMRLTAISWNEITRVKKYEHRDGCIFRIFAADGRRISLNTQDYTHGTELVDHVERVLTARRLRRRRDMAAGSKCAGDAVDVLPDDVVAKAATSGLGDPTSICVGHPWRWRKLPFALVVAPGGVCFAYIFIAGTTSGRSDEWPEFTVLVVLYVVGVLLYACNELDPRRRRERIFVFSRGLVRRDRRMRLTAISWDEITHVEKGRYSCRISTADGRRIRVNSADYSHGTDFVDQVELEVTDRGLQVEKT